MITTQLELTEAEYSELQVTAGLLGKSIPDLLRGESKARAAIKDLVVLPLEKEVAKKSGLHRKTYHPSHGSGLEDCLTAATANHHDLTLQTLNTRHFPMVRKLVAPYSK